jgi:DNA ligase 1
LYLDGANLIDTPLKIRRELLTKIVKEEPKLLRLSKLKEIETAQQAHQFYIESLAAGNEGIMFKTKDAPYKPGSRVGYMVKLKPVMDTLDLVVTQATWGEGKRASWLTSFVLACIDENGQLHEIGRCGTGFKELEGDSASTDASDADLSFGQMTKLIEPLILSTKGKEVHIKPELVLEIAYEEIQKSESYSSGYALRFPRVVGLRDTRSIETASTIDVVEDYFYAQKKRQ